MTVHMKKELRIFESLIQQRLESRKSADFVEKNDVLDELLSISKGNSDELKILDIPHLLLDLFGAGTNTTSSTIQWAMAELLRNPKVMKILKEELEQVVGKDKQLEEEDIARLPYLQAVIKETLRLHPPSPFLVPRIADKNIELCGFTVLKNTMLAVNVWAIGRDPNLWWNADSFEPQRFMGSHIDFEGHDFELIPFGAGRRICPGLSLAHRMLHLILGSMIHSFDWKLEDGVTPENVNMDDSFGFILWKARSLHAIPVATS
ncbi:hypothetical protein Ancab_039977 [Ancistrocladus abbreviatus]